MTDHLKLTINGQEFDTEDLTYGEQRAIRRLIRNEVWNEDLDGPFDWDEVGEFEILPATICVLMRRENPQFTIEEAMGHNALAVMGSADEVPPTNSQDSSDQTDPSVEAGPQT